MSDELSTVRTCPHRVNVWIFRHNFVSDKAKIRRRAVALQGFLTQSLAKFDEKTCMNPYVDRFLLPSALRETLIVHLFVVIHFLIRNAHSPTDVCIAV